MQQLEGKHRYKELQLKCMWAMGVHKRTGLPWVASFIIVEGVKGFDYQIAIWKLVVKPSFILAIALNPCSYGGL